MATITAAPSTVRFSARRVENLFFVGMSLLFLATVFLGFAHSYFLAGMLKAPLPNALIHVHGAVFSSWIILLLVQVSLVSAGRLQMHRNLGIFGAVLALAMFVTGLLASMDEVAREFSPPGSHIDPKTFYAIPFLQIVIFSVLVTAAFLARFDPAKHKRLMLIATISLLGPAVNRWPFALIQKAPPLTFLVLFAYVLLVVAFDLWSRRTIHRATLRGGLFFIVSQQLMFPIGHTALWHSFATWTIHIWNSSR